MTVDGRRWALLLTFGLLGCLTTTPVKRLPNRTPIVVVYVFDPDGSSSPRDVPAALKESVAAALAERNLEVVDAPMEKFGFDRIRESQQRFREVAKDAPLAMLVEARASLFAQVAERYRWNVSGRITIGKKEETAVTSFEDAAYLDFDHQREGDALAIAAQTFARRAAALTDQFMSGAHASAGSGGDAIYFVMVDRFANGDRSNDGAVDPADPQAFHGGDLQGVIDHLDELQRLGVGTVWLSPVFKMRTEKFFGYGAFHGYWVEDLNRVEPRFGSAEKLAELSDALHRRGMRLMLDMVLNHVGPDAPLVREHPEWFHREGKLEDWNDPEQLVRRDVKGLPDLAQEREPVFQYLLQASLGWIDRVHPDAFRLDAVKHVGLPFWARYNDAVHAHAGARFELLGEQLEGNPADIARVQREGHFDAMFDFPLHFAAIDVFCKGAAPERLGAVLSNDRLYEHPESLVTLADNHDLPRLITSCGGDVEKARQALEFLLTARGTPAITYGTEAGLSGVKEPENRGDMTFVEGPLAETIRRTLELRREHAALRGGAPRILRADRDVFAYARVAPEEVALIVVNHGGETRVEMPGLSTVAAHGVSVAFASGDFEALAARRGRVRDVRFDVQGGTTEPVYVVGSAPELGGWNPAKGLGTVKGSAKSSLPVGAVVEYKLVAMPTSGAPKWEGGDNHVVFVQDGEGPLEVELSWNQG